MTDSLLKNLKESFSKINAGNGLLVESHHAPLRSDKVFLSESAKRFPHLTESFLIENKALVENINFFKVTVKEIQQAFPGLKFAEARAYQKSFMQFAIAEFYSRTNASETEYVKMVNESSQTILELVFDPEKTLRPDASFDPNKTIGPRSPKIDYPENIPAQQEKKPGMVGKIKQAYASVKEFVKKAGEFVIHIAKSKETYKALAIGATMVILGVIAGALGGWAAIGFGAVKAILGGVSIFKGAKGLIKSADFAKGKTGVDGVKEWIKSAKRPAAAAKIIINLSQIALGAWGASSAIGNAMTEIKDMAQIEAQQAPTAPEANPETPVTQAPVDAAAAVAEGKTNAFLQKMSGHVRNMPDQYLENPEKYNGKIFAYMEKTFGVNLDGPVDQAIKGAHGNMSAREYIEMNLEGVAKAAKMSKG